MRLVQQSTCFLGKYNKFFQLGFKLLVVFRAFFFHFISICFRCTFIIADSYTVPTPNPSHPSSMAVQHVHQ